jgi:hypothetical protein
MTKQPESRLQAKIQKMVKERGGFVFKVHGNELMMAGLPDLISCYLGLFVAWEVKTLIGVVSERQRYVMKHIMNAQGIVIVPRSLADVTLVLNVIDECAGDLSDVTDVLSATFNDERWRR